MATICKDCVSGYILPGEPKGTIQSNGAYFVTGSENSPSKAAVVIITDVFGLSIQNPKIIADMFAEKLGCDVYVPDIFNGRPPLRSETLGPYLPDVPNQPMPRFSTFWYAVEVLRALPSLLANLPPTGEARVVAFIRSLKYEKIGAIGYCFGGGVVLRMLKRPDLLTTAISAHPGPSVVSDVANSVTPVLLICSEEDNMTSPQKVELYKAEIAKQQDKLKSELIQIPGTTHGFATRPNLGIPKVKEGFEAACDASVDWFKRTLL